jgi:exopolysaccharide biosynthesis polyprenyl glycosylphosphotransferase
VLAAALDAASWARLRLLLALLLLYLASSAALFAAPTPIGVADRWIAAIFPLLTVAILCARRSPDERLHRSAVDVAAHVLGAVSLAAMLTIGAGDILGAVHPLGLSLRLWVFATVYLGISRVVLLSLRRALMRVPRFATPTLIVGAGMVGEHLVKRFSEDPAYGMRPVGYLDSDPLPRPQGLDANVPVLGGPRELGPALAATRARHVILAFSAEPDRVLVDCVAECQRLGVSVSLVPRLYESINERATLDFVGGLPLLTLRPTNPRGWEFAVKHAFDRTFAAFSLLVLLPLLVGIALLVRLTSHGPVLFRQRRLGRDGRAFDVLKFRTMREAGEPSRFEPPSGLAPGGVEGQDRRTAVGRILRDTSLDELPQLINVLRGEMSVVGPRPERPEYVERFSLEVARYGDRHRVKSGITGWAQVNGLRGQTSIADRVEWDNYYIQNWSLRLDLRILALTVSELVKGLGDGPADPGRSGPADPGRSGPADPGRSAPADPGRSAPGRR